MDTRDRKLNNELGRHQRVLDAYLAHAGGDSMPPAALDAKLIALAASSIKAASQAPAQYTLFTHSADGINAPASKTNTHSRRRRWPFALAASVATIGFAAILARTTFQDVGYDKAVYQTPSYEAESVAADQAPSADAQISMETPAPIQEAMRDNGRAQAPSIAVMPPAEATAAPPPASPIPEVAELEVQTQRNRRSDVEVAPLVSVAPENDVAETATAAPAASAKAYEPSAFATDATPVPQTLSESPADSAELPQATAPLTRREAAQAGASAPQDDAANAKKDEPAPDAQTDLEHAKTYAAIRALRDSGELAQAKAMLARFKKAYPLEILPDDLKALVDVERAAKAALGKTK